jgi:hypothetical protein
LPSITGGFVKSANFTGCAFSGGSKLLDFPVAVFVDRGETLAASGVVDSSGLGEIEGAEELPAGGVSVLLVKDVLGDDCVD